MNASNALLRSAYQIASRKGENTNWKAFLDNLQAELTKQAGVAGTVDEQTVLRATCTPLTYRLPVYNGVVVSEDELS